MKNILLNDGNLIPSVGFGVFMIPNDGSTYNAVKEALRAGYRHIDTAAAYFNEAEVGNAVRDSGISRKDIFVTSKLWIQDYGYEAARAGIETSLRKLNMDYICLLYTSQEGVLTACNRHSLLLMTRLFTENIMNRLSLFILCLFLAGVIAVPPAHAEA